MSLKRTVNFFLLVAFVAAQGLSMVHTPADHDCDEHSHHGCDGHSHGDHGGDDNASASSECSLCAYAEKSIHHGSILPIIAYRFQEIEILSRDLISLEFAEASYSANAPRAPPASLLA